MEYISNVWAVTDDCYLVIWLSYRNTDDWYVVIWLSHRNDYVALLALLLLLCVNPWLIVKTWPVEACYVKITLDDVYLKRLNWFLFLIVNW